MKEIKDRSTYEVLSWTANEVKFYLNMVEDFKAVITQLARVAGVQRYGIP